MDWNQRAREMFHSARLAVPGSRLWSELTGEEQRIFTVLADEAYQAGIQKHLEHHRCERCHAAGVTEERARCATFIETHAVEFTDQPSIVLASNNPVGAVTRNLLAAALRAGRGEG